MQVTCITNSLVNPVPSRLTFECFEVAGVCYCQGWLWTRFAPRTSQILAGILDSHASSIYAGDVDRMRVG